MTVKNNIGMGIGTLCSGDPAKENKSTARTRFRVIVIIAGTNNHIVFPVAIEVTGG